MSHNEHTQHHTPPEVVIPLRVTAKGSHLKASGWLSYSLHLGGRRHIVHMKVKKAFLARHLPVFTYTDQGALLEDQPFIKTDCFYHGYVEGDPESLVALSTCFGGFQGMFQISDIIYEIKPKMFSSAFEHLVFKMESDDPQFPSMRCGLTEEEIMRQIKLQESDNHIQKQSSYERWWTHLLIIEMAIVVDHNRFQSLQSNVTIVQAEVFNVLNLVGTFYVPLEIEIFLSGIEIWSSGNILTHSDIEELLTEFCIWKHNAFNFRIHHDIVHLIADRSFGMNLGLAYVGTVCLAQVNCAVLSFMGYNLADFSVIMAHELGHNLGMLHDTTYCTCGKHTCIMFPAKTASNTFSNCSYAEFWDGVSKRTCMLNRGNPQDLFIQRRCGNNMVEGAEACDCGTLKSCEKDPCCQLNCNLTPGALCAFGGCCQNCSFMPSGDVCRAQVNECDLPEWCNGASPQCPEDVYVQDGTQCPNDGYCYEKNCSSRDEQCRKIFGKEAKSANQSCYREVNTRGDRFGHCGMIEHNQYKYVKCSISDILCGRIQCENVTEIPRLKEHSTVHSIDLNGVLCWGTDYHFGMTIPDIGEVKDGTKCGPENICIHRKCVSMPLFNRVCSRNTCNRLGVCNNKGHCHCDIGKAPPRCLLDGDGGSFDSGPPPHKEGKKEHKQSMDFPVFSLIPLFAILLCLFFLCKRSKKKQEEEEDSD
ncbi:disintegrin and metalloproteinase domain-containing protein 20-like [Choloepus didactylus]|uniref:disintegrin and metalloproteinase domain-containing protein 20-like n=1 Tax=Choloepus didactylus TaxID=27675 RepID=UPI00189F884B|nr:disintegrin and metalloproteinase domain-containing protein 20-like [Choloepus didactylus]